MLGFRIRYFGEIFSPGFGAGYALPAFLNAVLRVTLGGLVCLPALDIAARNAGVHDLADSAGLPLCRDIGVAQCFRIIRMVSITKSPPNEYEVGHDAAEQKDHQSQDVGRGILTQSTNDDVCNLCACPGLI